MTDERYMIDNSAMNRIKLPEVAAVLVPLLNARQLCTCGAIEVEALYSAKNSSDYEKLRLQRATILEYVDSTEEDWQAALRIQAALASKSQHRGPKVPDLIISAVAKNNHLTVMHYDSDFERISEFSDVKSCWVVPLGSLAK
ncbi:PIN domain nuclease [Amycolatopsis sp. NPDC051045]|uniref:PIN domain nuclease n=1 Tax=Amycolatopsis sp. NPDC051045 TaxID=3156922 RepID=UPI00343DFDB1